METIVPILLFIAAITCKIVSVKCRSFNSLRYHFRTRKRSQELVSARVHGFVWVGDGSMKVRCTADDGNVIEAGIPQSVFEAINNRRNSTKESVYITVAKTEDSESPVYRALCILENNGLSVEQEPSRDAKCLYPNKAIQTSLSAKLISCITVFLLVLSGVALLFSFKISAFISVIAYILCLGYEPFKKTKAKKVKLSKIPETAAILRAESTQKVEKTTIDYESDTEKYLNSLNQTYGNKTAQSPVIIDAVTHKTTRKETQHGNNSSENNWSKESSAAQHPTYNKAEEEQAIEESRAPVFEELQIVDETESGTAEFVGADDNFDGQMSFGDDGGLF